MNPDRDIWRAANLLIREHAAEAEMLAARRADEMLERGDRDGQLVWLRIRWGSRISVVVRGPCVAAHRDGPADRLDLRRLRRSITRTKAHRLRTPLSRGLAATHRDASLASFPPNTGDRANPSSSAVRSARNPASGQVERSDDKLMVGPAGRFGNYSTRPRAPCVVVEERSSE
jgi:hypothetical protein